MTWARAEVLTPELQNLLIGTMRRAAGMRIEEVVTLRTLGEYLLKAAGSLATAADEGVGSPRADGGVGHLVAVMKRSPLRMPLLPAKSESPGPGGDVQHQFVRLGFCPPAAALEDHVLEFLGPMRLSDSNSPHLQRTRSHVASPTAAK
jgi:hypothetical protein